MLRRLRFLFALFLLAPFFALGNPDAPMKSDYNPPLAKASGDAVKAIGQFKRDASLTVEVWAAEPMLAHPVAFCFDEKGRCYVAETFRHSRGVTDNRSHMKWLDDELALRTVAERVELYRKDAGAKFSQTYEKERERVRLIEDTTGSNKADKATVFCDDFGRAEDGIGAGLLARNGNVYYTCIPDLWLLKDTKGTGVADVKQSLSTGYGVHTAFIGHDLHGLRIGPDGKLYFTVGDRGLNVTAKDGKKVYYPDAGAVLRCDLDGSNLEMVATGLRNPQELAFDDFGNLFTVDNNSDSGDQARFVHIVEGGDSGWRIGYQYGSGMHDATVKQGNRGPWNYEQLWKPQAENKAAYVVPPLLNYSNGPSGFTAYPGVGLAERYKNHFFLANFSGQPGASGIFSFTVKAKGATFEMADAHQFMWNILSTDCEFGPDGGFYVSDWVQGWDINGKGRIYRVTDAEAMKNPAIPEAKKLLAEGFAKHSVADLLKLLAHPHRQVRQEAQFALAGKGKDAIEGLASVATKHENRLARLHAIWGLGMVGRQDNNAYTHVVALFGDADVEVRANTAKVYGEAPKADAAKLVPLLADKEPRVRMMAGLALARGAKTDADADAIRTAVFTMLQANADQDPVLRHAGIEALAKRVDAKVLAAGASHESAAVRMGCVLALRKQQSPETAVFLNDSDSKIVDEAARAINDQVITDALPTLAALSTKSNVSLYTAYRVLNAHYLQRKPENAQAIANYAARAEAPPAVRALALKMLADWENPPRRDYITGLTQKLPPRRKDEAVTAINSVLARVFAGPDIVLKEAVTTATKLGLKEVGPFLTKIVTDEKATVSARIDALLSLQAIKDPKVQEMATKALAANDPQLRNTGRSILFKTDAPRILGELKDVLNGSNIVEQQGALALLAANPSQDTDALLLEWLEKAATQKVPPALLLDVLEAAGLSKNGGISAKLKAYESKRPKDELGKYRETLVGGDAVRGRDLFVNKAAVQCQRCHQLDGQGGEVGPPVNGVGKQNRDYLLESIVLPSKAIAKGYESVSILTFDGKTVSGVLRAEDAKELKLITPEGKTIIIKKDNIDERKSTKSAMPDDLAPKLTKRELRDLVEFLATLKEEWKKP